jgi:uncharacterized protein DUF1579
METPKPTAAHRRLEGFAGHWEGEETVYASPWTKAGKAKARRDARMGVDGFFLIDNYREERDDGTMVGHGVIGYDPKQRRYTLHWFDNFGTPPSTPGLGRFEGDSLVFDFEYPDHRGRTVYELDGDDGHVFRVEMAPEGEDFQPIVEGRYKRIEG